MFDGLFIDNKFNDFNIIDKCNELTKKYGIKWIEKEHSDKIKIDNDMILPVYESNYTKLKNEFEETHFMIEQPLTFGVETLENNKNTYYLYSKADFMTLCETYQYTNEKNDEETSLFKTWIKDKDKRSYKRIIFDPSTTDNIDNQYNIFNGFNYNELINNNDYDNEGVELFINHIKLLCNDEEESTNYLIKYIADLFQNPNVLPQVAICITGKKGVGKDLLIDYLQKIIDIEYITRTQKFSNLFGNFNSALKNKLIISINEVSGKDGFTMKEDLKNFITEDNIIVNEKGLKPYTLKNYARLFMFCNNENPIEITEDNRRFWVVKTGDKQQSKYYDNLYNNINDNNILHSIYSYFMNIDLNEYNIRKYPITKKMKIMQEHNINPLYYYLNDTYENITQDKLFINGKDMFMNIINYYENEGHSTSKLNARSVKSFLTNINNNPIEYKVKYITGKSHRGYEINIKQLLETIQPLI